MKISDSNSKTFTMIQFLFYLFFSRSLSQPSLPSPHKHRIRRLYETVWLELNHVKESWRTRNVVLQPSSTEKSKRGAKLKKRRKRIKSQKIMPLRGIQRPSHLSQQCGPLASFIENKTYKQRNSAIRKSIERLWNPRRTS